MRKPGIPRSVCGMVKVSVTAAGLAVLCGLGLAVADGPAKGKKDPAAALQKAAISLTDAVARAEEKTGGKAVEAELEVEKDAVVFEVEILKDGAELEVKIDAATGKVLATEAEEDDKGGEGDKEEASKEARLAEALKSATVPLSGAILKAESETGGKAVEAELELKRDGAVYEVTVIQDGSEIEVVVDPATGKVVKVEKDDDDTDQDEAKGKP